MCLATGNTDDAALGVKKPATKAADVPLGDGMADAARLAILTRRERIRRAVEGE